MATPSPTSHLRQRARTLAFGSAFVGITGLAALLLVSPGAWAEAPKTLANPTTAVKPKTADPKGLVAPAATKPASKAAPEYLTMMCRGPFLLSGASSLDVRGRRTERRPGEWGANLEAGECALTGRSLAGLERPEIHFQYGDNVHADRMVSGVAPTLAACALSSECVMQATVRLGNAGYWHAKTNEAVNIWKHGWRP